MYQEATNIIPQSQGNTNHLTTLSYRNQTIPFSLANNVCVLCVCTYLLTGRHASAGKLHFFFFFLPSRWQLLSFRCLSVIATFGTIQIKNIIKKILLYWQVNLVYVLNTCTLMRFPSDNKLTLL